MKQPMSRNHTFQTSNAKDNLLNDDADVNQDMTPAKIKYGLASDLREKHHVKQKKSDFLDTSGRENKKMNKFDAAK